MAQKSKGEGEKKPQAAAKKPDSGAKTAEKNDQHINITRKEHNKLRRRAVAFERDNARFILLIPCDGGKGWYEMGNRSALFYKYGVANKLGIDVEIKDDYDTFFDQFDSGRVRTQYIDSLRENLKRAKMYKGEIERDNCIIFKLNKTYTDVEIKEFEDEEKRHQAQLNEIVKVRVVDPVVMVEMTDISMRLHRLCLRRMDKVSRETNGVRIVGFCDEIIVEYYKMASALEATDEEVLARWKEMRHLLHKLLIELQLIVDLKIWKRTQVISIGEKVAGVIERIDTHIRKLKGRTENANTKCKKNCRSSKLGYRSGTNAPAGAKKMAAN